MTTLDAPQARPPARRLRLTSRSARQTRALGAALAEVARPGDRLALIGPLGAGKTQFAKGFAAGLGVEDVVNSPSFTLMAEYEGRLPLFHQDLYRLAGTEEALAGGLLDERQDEGVTLSEWAERLDEGLDRERLRVAFRPLGEEERDIEVSGSGEIAARYLEAARRWSERAAGGSEGAILALDTSTHTSVVVIGRDEPLAVSRRAARHRHGTHVLEQIEEVLGAAGASLSDLTAVAVGTGPGSFTGLRVGSATAKTIAYARSLALVGLVSSDVLRRAAVDAGAPADVAVVQPAGAHDLYLSRPGEAPVIVSRDELPAALDEGPWLAVDLDADRLPPEAVRLGAAALEGLPAAQLSLARERLLAGRTDDVAELVPAYVSLPRGVPRGAEELGWSPDLR